MLEHAVEVLRNLSPEWQARFNFNPAADAATEKTEQEKAAALATLATLELAATLAGTPMELAAPALAAPAEFKTLAAAPRCDWLLASVAAWKSMDPMVSVTMASKSKL